MGMRLPPIGHDQEEMLEEQKYTSVEEVNETSQMVQQQENHIVNMEHHQT